MIRMSMAVLMSMILILAMRGRRMSMRAGFRLERRLDGPKLPAQSGKHSFQHVIAANAQGSVCDLHGRVTIAEMPGKARELDGRARLDLDHRLGLRHHDDHRAVVEHQAVEIEQEFRTALAGERNAAPVPLLGVEHDAIERAARIESSRLLHAAGPLHHHCHAQRIFCQNKK